MPRARLQVAPDVKAERKTRPGKSGRPFKASSLTTPDDAQLSEPDPPVSASPKKPLPPSVPFRAFKVALSNMKERGTIPDRVDRSVWTNQLFGLDLHGILNAYRFLQLIDAEDRPTEFCRALVEGVDTDAWPGALQCVLEKAYEPLLACSMSSLTAGGLMSMFREIYRTPNEATRKCCSFFVHAGREAALDIGPFLLTNSRSRWVDGRRIDKRDDSEVVRVATMKRDQTLSDLVAKFPAYDASWPDDVKRLWLGAFNDLIQKFDAD